MGLVQNTRTAVVQHDIGSTIANITIIIDRINENEWHNYNYH